MTIRQTFPEAARLSERLTENLLSKGPEKDLWLIYDSTLDYYADSSFGDVIGHGSLTRRMGERSFQIGDRPLVVVDLMASTAGVRSLAKVVEGTFGHKVNGIAVSLTDDRNEKLKKVDESLGLRHLAGNLGRSATWRQLSSMLGKDKADYIVSAGIGGVSYIPQHEQFYAGTMNRLWRMLNPSGGEMMLDIPPDYILKSVGAPSIEDVTEALQEKDICAMSQRNGTVNSVLYVQRDPSDPSVLFP